MYEVQIRVIKTEFYPDIAEKYLIAGVRAGTCLCMKQGDNEKPEGLCATAWLDICRAVTAISNGASYHTWNNREGQTIGCCGDGVRPVVFEITRMD